MSDPMQHPNDPPRDPPRDPPAPEAGTESRKGLSPLVLILILIALLAFGWYYFNQRGSVEPTTTPTDFPAVDIGSEQEAAAERERATAPVRERPAAAAPAPSAPADRDAKVVTRVQPAYPPTAYRAGEEGRVVLRVDIDAAGRVGNVDISERSNSRELDRAAMNAVREWTFEPAIKDGKPAASTVEVPVDFTLDTQ